MNTKPKDRNQKYSLVLHCLKKKIGQSLFPKLHSPIKGLKLCAGMCYAFKTSEKFLKKKQAIQRLILSYNERP